MTQHCPYRVPYCLLAGLVCILPACTGDGHMGFLGYTSAPNYDCSIRTVFLPIEKNKTMVRGLEFDLTRAIMREIQTKTPYKIVDSPRAADTELICNIVNRKKEILNQNQLGETREGVVTMMIEVIWRDLRPGHEGNLLSGKGQRVPQLDKSGNTIKYNPDDKKRDLPVLVTPATTYQPELGASITTAQQELVNKAAVQIVSMMEVWK